MKKFLYIALWICQRINSKNKIISAYVCLFALLISNVTYAQSLWVDTNGTWIFNSAAASGTIDNPLNLSNSTSSVNTINAQLNSSISVTGSPGSGSQSLVKVNGRGGGSGTAGAAGPIINFNVSQSYISTTINGANYTAGQAADMASGQQNPTWTIGPGAVISVVSNGSAANNSSINVNNGLNFAPASGGNGGDITAFISTGAIAIYGSSGNNSVLPWQPAGAAASFISAAGTTAAIGTVVDGQVWGELGCGLCYEATTGNGGSGGAVNVTNFSTISIGSESNVVSGGFVGINAASIASAGSICCTIPTGNGGSGDGYQVTPNDTLVTLTTLQSSGNGNARAVSVINQGSISGVGPNIIGIIASSIGGAAQMNPSLSMTGSPSFYFGSVFGAGNGGNVTVNNSGAISLTGLSSIGIVAVSASDQQIVPTGLQIKSLGLTAGTVSLTNNASISVNSLFPSTQNGLSGGLLAISTTGWMVTPNGTASNTAIASGNGGNVTVNNSGSISVSGASAFGVAALSVGNSGIVSTVNPTNFHYYMGNVATSNGANSTGSQSSVVNTGNITITGQGSAGIIALSSGDGGVVSNLANPVFSSNIVTNQNTGIQTGGVVGGTTIGNNAGIYTANGGPVSVINSGVITTGIQGGGGEASIGIVAQSIGGGGGTSLGSFAVVKVGDAGGAGGVGGSVTVTNSNNITTINDGSLGILAQSIGGGGGNGANGSGLFAAVGGAGGSGGAGGAVTITNQSNITTSGDFAGAIIGQSVGGGGGHGGFSKSYGIFVSVGVGGAGGDGGDGGAVNFIGSSPGNSLISTTGNGSHGILLQSVGGGGGNGGSASSYSAGVVFSSSVALGGSGGGGGAGGAIGTSSTPVFNNGIVATTGHNAHGVLLQSIGGGGGNASSALAKTMAFSLPGYPEVPTIAFSSAIGGTGGNGGSGGDIYYQHNNLVVTQGNISHGVVLQSIGGGGGAGGDSTAGANAYGNSKFTFSGAVSVGGSGGQGGSGSSLFYTSNTEANTGILTYGQNSSALVLQSIGGGGGIGGTGNASQASASTGSTTVNLVLGVGGAGGSGGNGSGIHVNNSTTIISYGSSSSGMIAQSIGGGGGIASGAGTQAISGGYTANIAVGGAGGSGGTGGNITISNSASISTGAQIVVTGANALAIGGDSHGIIAQSIGGGGGIGGASDPSANIISNNASLVNKDANGYLTLSGIAQYLKTSGAPFPTNYVATVTVGGQGGSGGNGGNVSVTNNGPIANVINTFGHRSYGILAQSIGGGGGVGGSVMSTTGAALGSSASGGAGFGALTGLTFQASVNLGGSGGVSGSGGTVTVTNNAAINTFGYSSFGVVAQSIGGGGGIGHDGSVAANTGFTGSANIKSGAAGAFNLALGSASPSAAAGNGGAVTFGGANGSPSNGNIATFGDTAVGLVLQSIGGGGGIASGGCTNSVSGGAASACLANISSPTFVTVGQAMDIKFNANVNGGQGGAVTVNDASAWTTYGQNAHGIVAQSIGGSGGMALANSQNIASITTSEIGAGKGSAGPVTVSVQNVNTYGNGAYGVIAQSIGGGGGLAGDLSAANIVTSASSWNSNTYNNIVAVPNQTTSNGGAVTVNVSGLGIVVQGNNSVGIFAQSIGGGGGLYSTANGISLTGAPSSKNGGAGVNPGTGGPVIINVGAPIIASGAGSVGIVAVSQGNSTGSGNTTGSPISINISQTNSAIATGITAATGILISGGEVGTNVNPNTITVGAGSFINAGNGYAVIGLNGTTQVINAGTITGGIAFIVNGVANDAYQSVVTSEVSNLGVINQTAPFIVSNNSFKNYGSVYVSGPGLVGDQVIQGSYKQFSTGITYFDINPIFSASDHLTIKATGASAGTMFQSGTFLINRMSGSQLPVRGSSFRVLTAEGGFLSSANGINAEPIKVFDTQSPIVDWQLNQDGNNLSVVHSGLKTNPPGIDLNKNQQNILNYLAGAYSKDDTGANYAVSRLVTNPISSFASGLWNSNLSSVLDGLNGQAQTIQQQTIVMTANGMLGNSLSCPTLDQNNAYSESECFWGKFNGARMRQSDSDVNPGYRVNENTFLLGFQKKTSNDVFIGGSFRYGQSNSSSTNFAANADVGDISIGLKKIVDDYYFGISGAVGVSSQSNNRYAYDSYLGQSYNLNSHNNVFYGGIRVRNAYQFNLPSNSYVRPYLDLDGLWTYSPSYQESGVLQGVPLKYNSQSGFNVIASPMIEFGGRVDLDGPKDTWLRPFVSVGAMFITNNSSTLSAAIVGTNSGTFNITTQAPSSLFKANAGIQVFSGEELDIKLEYSLIAGGGFVGQSGSVKASFKF